MNATQPPEVKAVFESYAPEVRERLLELRELILDTAAATVGVGKLEETLRWGEPAYLTAESKSGSTIRVAPVTGECGAYALFFICQTNLVETFRHWFPHGLRFEGNRAIVFNVADTLPRQAVAECVAAALTYHRVKGRHRGSTSGHSQ